MDVTTVAANEAAEHFDVVIVGAGISGIAAAYHLQQQRPETTFVVLETQESFGGTWLTHKYPGIRSDSDLYTFGYRFKPWMGAPIATADEIRRYMGEVIDENNLAPTIRYNHRVEKADWSPSDKCWTLSVSGERERQIISAGFLWMCQGYYRHSDGYTPDWDGMEDFRGTIVHPMRWPTDLDYAGKRMVVIGSGATAATLVPAVADAVDHVTMLQRSPTYFITGRNANELADQLRQLDVDPMWIHEIVRRKLLFDGAAITKRSFEEPDALTNDLLLGVRAHLPEDVVAEHFTPTYRPWRQRIAFIPDADLFAAMNRGKASVVTDEIERFTENGILLKSGDELVADIIVTATGFHLSIHGDIEFSLDGQPLDFADTVTYRGMMFTGVPNLCWVFGYFRASWTLRADLVADFVCRLLGHMESKGSTVVTPGLLPDEAAMPLLPWIDPENFNPGYIMRGMHLLPKRGDKPEWEHSQNYWAEKDYFPLIDLGDGRLVFE